MNYEIKENDEVIVDDGKRYAVKAPWTKFEGPGNTFTTRVVAEGAMDMGGGWYAAELIEAYRDADGMWEVIGHSNEEDDFDGDGIKGVWGWNENDGVKYFSVEEVMAPVKTDPVKRTNPVWFHGVETNVGA